MKRIFITLLTLILVIPTANANASAKPGGACKRVGESAVAGSERLICAKNGKKSLWNKRADVTVFATGPTGRLVYRYVGSNQERQSLFGDWIKKDSRNERSFDPIRVAAYKSIRAL